MERIIAATFYNAAGVTPRNDPASPDSLFAVERLQNQLASAISPGIRVLDLGCNAGRFCFAMEAMGALPVGIDGASIPLSHAKALARERRCRCTFVEGDLHSLPFTADSFNLALFPKNIVEHSYSEIDGLARQLRAVLVRGGRFCVEMTDWLLTRGSNSDYLAAYEMSTGRERSMQPMHIGTVPLDSYFWTVAFAKHVIGRHLTLVEETQLGTSWFWLVFQKE